MITRIFNFKNVFYLPQGDWILMGGVWSDAGFWHDTSNWID